MEESKILFIYRYISLFITSVFYLLNQPDHSIARKVIIIGCISVSAVILSYLYRIYENSNIIKKLIMIETIGNSILLIPSGGINSPFIWYTLNTILISSIYFNYKYCLINILTYIGIISSIVYLTPGITTDIRAFLRDESSLILSFIMIIASIQVWSLYVRKTKEKSISLSESMDHIKGLYQSVNILTNQGNKEGLIKLLFDNVRKITKTNTVFYYDMTDEPHKIVTDGNPFIAKSIEERLRLDSQSLLNSNKAIETNVLDNRLIFIKVESNTSEYGILGYVITEDMNSIIHRNNLEQLEFLSELVSFAFERLSLEEVSDRLLITEEQNRIANEIHDSVLQKLFGISCGVYSLMKRVDIFSNNEMEPELNNIRLATDSVMKELREKIYGLSWKKSGLNSFKSDINKYIDDTRRFNNISIPFYMKGNDELLSLREKKAIYRIICEGIGNAVRHGKSKTIEVSLIINRDSCVLKIIDDGIGINLSKTNRKKIQGLGIKNIYQLTDTLKGEVEIISKDNEGTRIEVKFPINGEVLEEEESIV